VAKRRPLPALSDEVPKLGDKAGTNFPSGTLLSSLQRASSTNEHSAATDAPLSPFFPSLEMLSEREWSAKRSPLHLERGLGQIDDLRRSGVGPHTRHKRRMPGPRGASTVIYRRKGSIDGWMREGESTDHLSSPLRLSLLRFSSLKTHSQNETDS